MNNCELKISIPLNFSARFPSGTPKGVRLADQAKEDISAIRNLLKEGTLQKQFAEGVKNAWDNKFKLCCVCDDCQEGLTIRVAIEERNNGYPVYLYKSRGMVSNQDSWNLNQGVQNVAAHEIGHFLGNIDEYRSVSNVNWNNGNGEYKGAKGTDFGAPNQKGGNIMNNSNGEAFPIHMWYAAERGNSRKEISECRVIKKEESCK